MADTPDAAGIDIGARFASGAPVTRQEFAGFFENLGLERDQSGAITNVNAIGTRLAAVGYPPDKIEGLLGTLSPQDLANPDAFAQALARNLGKPLTVDAKDDPTGGAYTTADNPGALPDGAQRTQFDKDGKPVPVTAVQPPAAAVDTRAAVGQKFLSNFKGATDPAAGLQVGDAKVKFDPARFAEAEAQALGLKGHQLTREEKIAYQQFLKDTLGLSDDQIKIDGKFGAETRQYSEQLREVIRDQQKAAGLTGKDVDGLAGKTTQSKLAPATPTP